MRHDLQAQSLLQAEEAVMQQRQAYESLDHELAQALQSLSSLQNKHDAQAQSHSRQVLLLKEDIESGRQHISTVDSDLLSTIAKATAAEERVMALNETVQNLQIQLQSKTEQAESLQSNLLEKASEHDALVVELQTSSNQCQQLSEGLQQTEEALTAKSAELEDVSKCLASRDAEKVRQQMLNVCCLR